MDTSCSVDDLGAFILQDRTICAPDAWESCCNILKLRQQRLFWEWERGLISPLSCTLLEPTWLPL
jgi:hypothetical protein